MTDILTDAPFVGQKIVGVRQLESSELKREGWDWVRPHQTPTCIVLENGTILYPMQDEEGNGPGVLVGHDKETDSSFYCIATSRS
jgi:fumarylacetoacetate (FAA) hydrolase family protein